MTGQGAVTSIYWNRMERKGEEEHFGANNCIYNTDVESMVLTAVV